MDTCTKAGNDNSFSGPAQGREAGRPLANGVPAAIKVLPPQFRVNIY
jgi:hypothetical protein